MTLQAVHTAIVTTGRHHEYAVEKAKAIAKRWNLPYYDRDGASIAAVRKKARARGDDPTAVVVVHDRELVLYVERRPGPDRDAGGDVGRDDGGVPNDGLPPDHVFRYHPGMGVNRVRRLMLGDRDWMIEAMRLRPGDRILDATMGLGSDLLVASYVVGEAGVVVGLESELLLALMVSEGTKTYVHPHHEAITQSIRRIQVIHADYRTYLSQVQQGSFDVVYFDPMFDQPLDVSHQMIPMWVLGNDEPLDKASLDQALRVATRCVVVKDRRHGPYAESGWFDEVVGGRGSRIVFCIAKP